MTQLQAVRGGHRGGFKTSRYPYNVCMYVYMYMSETQ